MGRKGIRGELFPFKVSKPYVNIFSRFKVITCKKKVFKTYSRELSDNLTRNGFDILSVTTDGEGSRPKYTLWGAHEKLTSRHKQAIKDKVLFPMGFRDNDEQLVRLKREAREYK